MFVVVGTDKYPTLLQFFFFKKSSYLKQNFKINVQNGCVYVIAYFSGYNFGFGARGIYFETGVQFF